MLSIHLSHVNSRKIFWFDSFSLDYIGCINAVKDAWNFTPHGNPMHALSHTRIKVNLWRCARLNSLDFAIQSTEADILALEGTDSLNFDFSHDLSDLSNKFANLQKKNALRWAQHAHLNWLLNGDLNTTFFHNLVRLQSHSKTISHIFDLNGSRFSNHADIENAFISFYTNL